MLPFSLVKLAASTDTISGTLTVNDSPPITLWDDGATRWRDYDSYGEAPHLHIATRWDEPPKTLWDDGATRWLDVAPGWDVPAGTDRRRWVIGKANPKIYNLVSRTGVRLLARLWIKPPDPKTPATQARRALVSAAAAAWRTDKAACIATARRLATRAYSSDYNSWLSCYLTHNGNPPT